MTNAHGILDAEARQDAESADADPAAEPELSGGAARAAHTESREYKRLVRREVTRTRSATAVVIAVLVILAVLYIGVEIVLRVFFGRSLLLAPSALAHWVVDYPQLFLPPGLIAIGAALAILGVILWVLAFKPGRKAFHSISGQRSVALVDNTVIAAGLAATARYVAALAPGQVVVSVGARHARIEVTPVSGGSVDAQAIQQEVQRQADSWRLEPPVKVRVHVRQRGAVGA